jgi:FAD/FMN-containing dehydrogenase
LPTNSVTTESEVLSDAAESEKYWVIRRESFNLLRKHVHGKHTAPFIDDIVVRPEYMPEFLPQLYAVMNQYDITYTIAGHIGDGNMHIIPLMDFTRPDFETIIHDLSEKVYDLVLRYKGSISGEHNDGLVRTPFLSQMYGPDIITLFEQTKDIFDPHHIFNPGKKVYPSNTLATIKHT